MIEGSGSRTGSGSIPLTNESGSTDPDSDPDPQHCFNPNYCLLAQKPAAAAAGVLRE